MSLLRNRIGAALAGVLLAGCATSQITITPSVRSATPAPVQVVNAPEEKSPCSREGRPDMGVTVRPVTDEELLQVSEKDPDLTPVACREILSRLNIKAPYHISEDMARGKPLRVPNDFCAYREWTPMPARVPQLSGARKLILVVKDLYFLGWYEKGELQGDTDVCLGNDQQPTEAGVYKVEEKDPEHISKSYKNDLGKPAWMPWAMRIYEAVWIHAGDITSARCSHGCVTLPMKPAEELFRWADSGTTVVVLETLKDLDGFRADYRGKSHP